MTSKPQKQDDPKQSERFIEAAKKAEADESEEGAERAFKKVVIGPAVRVAEKRESRKN
jgi:hypothetical protein